LSGAEAVNDAGRRNLAGKKHEKVTLAHKTADLRKKKKGKGSRRKEQTNQTIVEEDQETPEVTDVRKKRKN